MVGQGDVGALAGEAFGDGATAAAAASGHERALVLQGLVHKRSWFGEDRHGSGLSFLKPYPPYVSTPSQGAGAHGSERRAAPRAKGTSALFFATPRSGRLKLLGNSMDEASSPQGPDRSAPVAVSCRGAVRWLGTAAMGTFRSRLLAADNPQRRPRGSARGHLTARGCAEERLRWLAAKPSNLDKTREALGRAVRFPPPSLNPASPRWTEARPSPALPRRDGTWTSSRRF